MSKRQLGPYYVTQLLGRGRFADVMLARHVETGRSVAIKRLYGNHSHDPAFCQHFQRMGEIGLQFDHPNIGKIEAVEEDRGALYFVMQPIAGDNLRQTLQQDGPLELANALPLLQQVASALDYLHALGHVHRDIRPSNILVEHESGGPHAFLTDFGMADVYANSRVFSATGTSMAPVQYQAPEQLRPQRWGEVSAATDVYALGVLAYELLTGRLPYPADLGAMLAAFDQPPPNPRDQRPQLNQALADVLSRAVDTRRAERFPSATALVAALANVSATPAEAEAKPSTTFSTATFNAIESALVRYDDLQAAYAAQDWSQVDELVDQLLPLAPALETKLSQWQAEAARHLTQQRARATGVQRLRKAMVQVPAGRFQQGDAKRLMALPSFWIDRSPVTNREYAVFVQATNHTAPSHWQNGQPPHALLDHPVVHVSWHDAHAFATWLGRRLPTEQEWEKAARGGDGRDYPWGAWQEGLCNTAEADVSTTTRVGQYSPRGDSPYGCTDMAGNVWEWTDSWADSQRRERVLRGGSWSDFSWMTQITSHYSAVPDVTDYLFGFRTASSDTPKG